MKVTALVESTDSTVTISVVARTSYNKIESSACSVGWFVSLLVREEVLLAGLCERK